MASPIAHSFAGFWTFLLLVLPFQASRRLRSVSRKILLLVFIAVLPDLDFLLEIGFGVDEVHRSFSHSLIAALVVSVGLGLGWRIVPSRAWSVLLYFTAYGSHLLIDFCTGATLGWTGSGSGIPLLWPWPHEFSSPLILFQGVRHANLAALFCIDNAYAATYEVLCGSVITVALLILWKQKLQTRMKTSAPKMANPTPAELELFK